MHSKFYFSPRPAKERTNEYVDNFFESLSKRVNLVNYNSVPTSRSVDYLKYAFDCDVMVLNWPEDILHLRFGIWQFIVSCLTFSLFRLSGGKIVWVCHNKTTHKKKHKLLSGLARKFYASISNYIIVHSRDAMNHFTHMLHKTYYLPHPVYSRLETNEPDEPLPPIDVLIWGNITPYKGLTEFVKYYKQQNCTFNVLIIGKAQKSYLKQLLLDSDGLNITIVDRFVENDLLHYYFTKSRIIALPYLDSDTFSSGALIHSLNSEKVIIGPAIGNFIDLHAIGACLIYSDRQQLFSVITHLLADNNYYEQTLSQLRKGIERYYNSNSWDRFINEFLGILRPSKEYRSYHVNKVFTIDSLN
jgi:beta-1,4-mannosyltransferase